MYARNRKLQTLLCKTGRFVRCPESHDVPRWADFKAGRQAIPTLHAVSSWPKVSMLTRKAMTDDGRFFHNSHREIYRFTFYILVVLAHMKK